MQGRGILVLVALSVAFAGCAKGSAEPNAEDPQGTSVISVGSETLADAGSIEGIVTDDTLLPLPGVVVGLLEVQGVLTTDENGAFAFRNLAPGPYTVSAAKLGYTSVASRVEVAAGETLPVQLVIQQITVAESFIESIEFRMQMACGGGLVAVTFTGGCPSQLFPNHDVTADHNVTGPAVNLRTVISELIWQATSGFSSKELRLTAGINESGGSLPAFGERYFNVQGPSPVYGRADADDDEPLDGLDETNERYFIRNRIWVPFSSADPPVVILVIEQPLTVWSSFFYGEAAPENFSALPDA